MILGRSDCDIPSALAFVTLTDVVKLLVIIIGFTFIHDISEKMLRQLDLSRDCTQITILRHGENVIPFHGKLLIVDVSKIVVADVQVIFTFLDLHNGSGPDLQQLIKSLVRKINNGKIDQTAEQQNDDRKNQHQ